MKLEDFNYNLPKELIAQTPYLKRDEARLLVVSKGKEEFEDKKFSNILEYMQKGDVLVLNETKVIPARLYGKKETGAFVEILLLKNLEEDVWEAMVRPGAKLKVGAKAYFFEKNLENADINTFGVVDSNNEYFFDKENVYYKTKILPVKNSGNLEIVSIDQGYNFLYDRKNGYVFLEDYSFDMEKAPYRVLGNKGNHIYDLLFVNNEGVYFYDNQAKKQKRAGDNIFAGKIEEVNPNVFTDDKNIYYLQSYDVKRKKKNKGSYADILVSKNIGVFYLGEKKNWEKIKDIDSGIVGQVWKGNDKYYYFDNLGEHQIVDDVIYEISDEGTLQELLNSENISSDKIREIINTKKLLPIRGKEVLTAAVKYKKSYKAEIFLAVFLTIFFVGKHFVLKKFKKLENMKEETDYYEL